MKKLVLATVLASVAAWSAAADSRATIILDSSGVAPDAAHVRAGLVDWHSSFEAACTRAQATQKPVLLFQLIGRLDERFC